MQENSRRILILSTAYLPQIGGSELAIKNITDRLPEFQFDLITSRFSPDVPAEEQIGNVHVYRVGNALSRSSFLLPKNFLPLAIYSQARALIFKHGSYDLIHAYQASQAAGAGWLLKWMYPRTPFVVTIQEGKVLQSQSMLTKLFRWLIFRKANAATVISAYLAEYVASQNAHLPIEIIPNGVDMGMFVEPEGNVPESHTVVTSSRLVEKNGIGDLINAFALVVQKVPEARLVIIGDGPQRAMLENKVQTEGLDSKVVFLGELSHDKLPPHLQKATIFVRPSLSEGLGTAFLEAMAAGTPIIGTPVGGIVDFLEDGQTGLFCKVGDAQDIAEKIITLLNDAALRGYISMKAKHLIRERYTWEKIAESFRNFYGTIAHD